MFIYYALKTIIQHTLKDGRGGVNIFHLLLIVVQAHFNLWKIDLRAT